VSRKSRRDWEVRMKEYEDSAGGDAGQTEGNDNSFLQEEDA
jgi:hypothetical protein